MNRKLKALGALLSAALMVGAIAVVSASAEEEPGGHFVSSVSHTLLRGTSHAVNPLELKDPAGNVFCPTQNYHGTVNAPTVESVTVTPTYGTDCIITGTTNTVHVDMNGCQYTFTVRKTSTKDSTVHLVCPAGQSVTLTVTLEHTNTVACIIHLPPQTPKGGVVYTNVLGGPSNLHTVTIHATASEITSTRTPQFFGGCQFLAEHGTTGELSGTAYIEGTDTNNVQVPITAT